MHISLLLYLYVLNAFIVALLLLWAFLSDRSTAKSHKLSWVMILVTSALWGVAVPLSLIEVLYRSWRQRKVLSSEINPSRYTG